jgi:tetratricopeptide (TPR) repeat protein
VLFNKGIALHELGHHEDAIIAYDLVFAIKPDDHEALNNKGNALGSLGCHEDAIVCYDLALDIEPDSHKVLNSRGISLSYLKRYQKAIASYDLAISIQPTDPSAYYNKACCYGLQGDVEQVLIWLQKAIDLAPEKCRERASTDSDFDAVRDDPRFQALLA